MADDELDFLLGELSSDAAPTSNVDASIASTTNTNVVLAASSTSAPAADAIFALDSMLDSKRRASQDDENVDSLLLELEDNRQSLLLSPPLSKTNSSNTHYQNLSNVPSKKPTPSLPPKNDVLGDADRILHALSMHGVMPQVASPSVVVEAEAPPVDDAEFDSLLSALEEPAAVVAQTQSAALKRQPSSNIYGQLPLQQHKQQQQQQQQVEEQQQQGQQQQEQQTESDPDASPYKDLPTKQEIFGIQSTGYDAGDDELGSLISELEPAVAVEKSSNSAEQTRILKNVANVREAFEAAIGDTVFAAQEQTGSLDNSILELSSACRTFVGTVREERRVFDNESVQRINESLLVVSKGTKGLAMAAQAFGTVPTAQQKMDGILEILQKQLDKIYAIFQECVKAI